MVETRGLQGAGKESRLSVVGRESGSRGELDIEKGGVFGFVFVFSNSWEATRGRQRNFDE